MQHNDPDTDEQPNEHEADEAVEATAEAETTDESFDFDEDDRLPWLESADEDEDDGLPLIRIIGFVVAGLVVLAAVIGGLYWLQNSGGPEGDGSLIAAPEGDYRNAPPEDQDGFVENEDDVNFAGAQGNRVSGQVADAGTPQGDGLLVQMGAFPSEAAAQDQYRALARRFAFIAELPRNVASATVDNATVYRLSVVVPDRATADSVCGRLQDEGQNCFVRQ